MKRVFGWRAAVSLALCVALMLLLAGAFAVTVINRSLEEDVTRRAIMQLEDYANEQTRLVKAELDRQFDSLLFLAQYPSAFSDPNGADMLEALKVTSSWCTIGLADLNGDTVSYLGKSLGNILNRDYFEAIVSGKSDKAVQYLEATNVITEPRILFSVPVYTDSALTGVLFASKEVYLLEPILLGNTGANETVGIIITDSGENIIAANSAARTYMRADESNIEVSCRIDSTGWQLTAFTDRSMAARQYSKSLASIKHTLWNITIVFTAATLLAAALLVLFSVNLLRQKNRESRIMISINQMQPHFLYNALASIREVIFDDPAYAADLICDFTTHLRACVCSMSKGGLVPFGEELGNIKAYVNIEKMRFGERLNIVYDIQASDFDIIPLSIQPLVENAIRHGVFEQGGTVRISTRDDGKSYVITVNDDGVGFDLASVRRQVRRGEKDSTGLSNTVFRLESLMGARVKIVSAVGHGTQITVCIPKKRRLNK